MMARKAGYDAALVGTAFLGAERPIDEVVRELATVFG
jgi:indole-3-glycerol phosphate synthase